MLSQFVATSRRLVSNEIRRTLLKSSHASGRPEAAYVLNHQHNQQQAQENLAATQFARFSLALPYELKFPQHNETVTMSKVTTKKEVESARHLMNQAIQKGHWIRHLNSLSAKQFDGYFFGKDFENFVIKASDGSDKILAAVHLRCQSLSSSRLVTASIFVDENADAMTICRLLDRLFATNLAKISHSSTLNIKSRMVFHSKTAFIFEYSRRYFHK